MVRLLILQLLFLSCATNKNRSDFFETHKSKGVEVVVLNKFLTIPKKDNYSCSDIIYIRLENNSNNEYVFELDSSITIFSNGSFGYGEFTYDADPPVGTILQFFDSYNKTLKCELVSGFNPEFLPFMSNDSDLKYLKPKSSLLLKISSRFPNRCCYGVSQYVPDLENARSVAIIFNTFGFHSYLDREIIPLKENQKILAIRKQVIIPVKFKENR